MDTEYVEFEDCKLLKSTDKAGLFKIENKQYWIPWSQVHPEDSIDKDGQEGTLVITQWIAEQKELV